MLGCDNIMNNSTQVIKEYFEKYLITEDENIILDCIQKYPNQSEIIKRLKNVFDNLDAYKNTFIKNIFDVDNDCINKELLNNLESQINNKTTMIAPVYEKQVVITSYYDFNKEDTIENCKVTKDEIMLNDGNIKKITEDNENTLFYNYIIEKLCNLSNKDSYIVKIDDKNYYANDNGIPEISNSKLIKEESLCETKEVQYYLDDKLTDENTKDLYLKRIFLDLITNQNYRDLNNGLGTIQSDLSQSNYYVLNDVTIKKDVAIESFYRNYFDSIKDISNIIIDNYELILDLFVDILKFRNDISEKYIYEIRNNIVSIYEKGIVYKTLNAIENFEEEHISDKRIELNNIFEINLKKLRKSLGLSNQNLTKTGYASIFTLISGIVLFGVLFAYLILIN